MNRAMLTVYAGLALTAVTFAADMASSSDVTPNINQGTKELRISGSLDTDAPLDYDLSVSGGYGMFVIDQLEVAGVVTYKGNDAATHMDIGVLAEYFFDTQTAWVPYVGAGLAYAAVEIDDQYYNDPGDADFDSVVGKGTAGIAYFLRECVAVELGVVYSYAADDLYVDQDGNVNDSNLTTMIGLRYFWD